MTTTPPEPRSWRSRRWRLTPSAIGDTRLRWGALTLAALLAFGLSVAAYAKVRSPYQGNHDSLAGANTVYIVGDSITASNSPKFEDGRIGDGSWVRYIGKGISFVGGWAQGGARTADMAANVKPSFARTLVIVGGSNDAMSKTSFSESSQNLKSIVNTVGSHRVIVSSIPPTDVDPSAAVAYNNQLKQLAEEEGWTYVDSMAGLRRRNRYIDGMTVDGIHPTRPGARVIGAALGNAIRG